jgi:hypothetical protein
MARRFHIAGTPYLEKRKRRPDFADLSRKVSIESWGYVGQAGTGRFF